MMSTERLGKSGDRIKESRRTILETEELGVSILQDLHSQRQSLLHANNTVVSYSRRLPIQFIAIDKSFLLHFGGYFIILYKGYMFFFFFF